MHNPVTDDERKRIAQLLTEGHSYRAIAEETGRGRSTIARVAKAIGHRAGQSNLARAHEARSAYSAERRALLAARFTEEAEQLLDQLHQEHRAFSFGGRDNVYTEQLLPEPDIAGKRQLVQAAREAMRTVLDIDRHDNRADERGAAEVDRWLLAMMGKDPEGGQ